MFRIDNTDNVIDVNVGNSREYDQANIVCPVVTDINNKEAEKYIIYNVSKEEYDSCRITNPNPRIVATCTNPHQLLYFTITFRSFTPTPGGLEFHPGMDYYFISTSRPDDLHRRSGGRCSTHNMKIIFKVTDNSLQHKVNEPRTTPEPQVFFDDKNKYYPVVEEAVEAVDSNTMESAKKVVRDFQNNFRRRQHENEVILKQEASRMASTAASISTTFNLAFAMVIYLRLFLVFWKNW